MSTSFGVICEKDKIGVAVVRFNPGPAVLAEDEIRPPASLKERPSELLYLFDEFLEVLVAHRPELVLVKHAVAGRFAADPQRYELGGVVQLACAKERVACQLFTTEQVRAAMGVTKGPGAYDSLLELPAVATRSNKAKREQFLYALAAGRSCGHVS
jgi:hypothetical protein